jgi:hypothetical protein
MSNIFLGKPLHWLLLIIIAAGLWYTGDLRLHIIHFDAFILALLAISVACVLLVLYGPGHGERITRDEIIPDETEVRLDEAAKPEIASE